MTPTVTISRELAEKALLWASNWAAEFDGVNDGFEAKRIRSTLAELRAALDAPASSGWRPIESGLPEYMTACLVWCPQHENAYCAYYHFYEGSKDPNRDPIWCFFDGDGEISKVGEQITHWHPLPPPPGDDVSTTDAITDSERIELRRLGSKWLAEADHANQQEGIARSQGHSEKCAVFSRQAAVYRTCALQLDAAIKQEKP